MKLKKLKIKKSNIIEIPKIFKLLNHLNKNGIHCPKPILNKNKKLLNSFKEKKYSLFNFLEGTTKKTYDKNHCYNVGKILGKIHLINLKFKYKIKNNFGPFYYQVQYVIQYHLY